MSEVELKSCPFCGETPDAESHYVNQGTKWGGIQCCIEGPEVRTNYKEWPAWKDNAIEAWNTRVPDITALQNELAEAKEQIANNKKAHDEAYDRIMASIPIKEHDIVVREIQGSKPNLLPMARSTKR